MNSSPPMATMAPKGEFGDCQHRPSARCRRTLPRTGLLLLLSFQSAPSATASSPRANLAAPSLPAFRPRGGRVGPRSRPSPDASAQFAHRKQSRPFAASPAVRTVGWRRKAKSSKEVRVPDFDEEGEYDPHSHSLEPTLKELRAQLGPIGLLASNAIELAVVTVGSYASGALLGYLGGAVTGVPSTLLGKDAGGFARRMSALHAKAFATCKSWGALSAAFSGFNNFVRMSRGGMDDGWNAIWGSALTGAFLSRSGGAGAMIQGGATYAGFTYFLEKFFSAPSSRQAQQSSDLLYTDVPIDG